LCRLKINHKAQGSHAFILEKVAVANTNGLGNEEDSCGTGSAVKHCAPPPPPRVQQAEGERSTNWVYCVPKYTQTTKDEMK
jgi:hypothetical protein